MSEIETKKHSRRAVITYTLVLVAVVLFFIGLSYFIEQRDDRAVDALHAQNSTAMQKIESLQTENVDMKLEIARLTMELETLGADNAALRERLADMQQQAAELENLHRELTLKHEDLLASLKLEEDDTNN